MLFRDSGCRCLNHCYAGKACKQMRVFSQRLSPITVFGTWEKGVMPLTLLIKRALLGKCTASASLTACHCVCARIIRYIYTRHSMAYPGAANALWVSSSALGCTWFAMKKENCWSSWWHRDVLMAASHWSTRLLRVYIWKTGRWKRICLQKSIWEAVRWRHPAYYQIKGRHERSLDVCFGQASS